MAEDIGESLVGSYLRYVEGCEFVLFNTFLPNIQGEIDVIGIKAGSPRCIYFAEVTTHLGGMTYGGNKPTLDRIRNKLVRAREFAQDRFPDDEHRFSVWSPRVPKGAMTTAFDAMRHEATGEAVSLEFVVNETYGDRIQKVIEAAKADRRATSDPAFRMLQILGAVRTSEGPLRL